MPVRERWSTSREVLRFPDYPPELLHDILLDHLRALGLPLADEAEGRVLFIDEAYTLSAGRDGADSFGLEAIGTIVAEMENRRGRVSVIAAGYEGEMATLLAANRGLKDRFDGTVAFPSYSTPELVEILVAMAAAEEFTLTEAAVAKACAWLDNQRAIDGKDFANARTVRKLLGMMKARLGRRLAGQPGDVNLDTFTDADVPDVGP